jgi:putative transposase
MRNPDLCSQREKSDAILLVKIKHIWDMNFRVYGARKVWHALRRQQSQVARCTVERLMARNGMPGARRGKRVRTTVPDDKALCPLDLVNRQFHADRPNRLWVPPLSQ